MNKNRICSHFSCCCLVVFRIDALVRARGGSTTSDRSCCGTSSIVSRPPWAQSNSARFHSRVAWSRPTMMMIMMILLGPTTTTATNVANSAKTNTTIVLPRVRMTQLPLQRASRPRLWPRRRLRRRRRRAGSDRPTVNERAALHLSDRKLRPNSTSSSRAKSQPEPLRLRLQCVRVRRVPPESQPKSHVSLWLCPSVAEFKSAADEFQANSDSP